MSEEEKQMFNKMIYCNLINGEQALKFNRKYEDLQQKVEQLENIINELEKWLIEHIDEYRDMEQDAMFEFGLVLDKLKELKENNK